MVTRIWILSAIASVRIMVGAVTEIGVSLTPPNPARPIAAALENPITRSVAKVAPKLRSIIIIKINKTPYMIGTRVTMSFSPASAKALFNIESPEIAIFKSGYSLRISVAIWRATATASGTSRISTWGICKVTLTPVVPASGEIRLLRKSGSARAIAWRLSSSACDMLAPSRIRSSTVRSSPSAQLYWKFVIESTRRA